MADTPREAQEPGADTSSTAADSTAAAPPAPAADATAAAPPPPAADNPTTGDNPVDAYVRIQLGKPDRRHTLAVLLVCSAVFVPQMGSYGMFDPWETHYTEVARQFMVRGDWLSTYWHNGTGPEGWSETRFWSKPVGSFWMSGLSLKLLGYDENTTGEEITMTQIEWAVRLPFFLCALFGIFCIYLMCARLFNRRTGLLAAAILTTAPMYFMIGRQAMTDMAYVGPMTGGIALFVLGLFGEHEPLPRRSARIGRFTLEWPHHPTYYLFLVSFAGIMTLQLIAIMGPLRRISLPFQIAGQTLSAALVMGLYIILSLWLIWISRKTRTRNEIYLYAFYICAGIAGLSKGLIGALQPGLIVFLYVLTSREWRILADVALGRGLLISACVFAPWYHGMLLTYGRSFWNELFGTEQIRRLTIGEQSQAKGTFEYYVDQLGYGLFPWIALLPGALVRAFGIGLKRQRTPRDRARLFVYVWLAGAVALFTITLTKYHHYILPAIPPAAIAIALFLDDLLEHKVKALPALLLTAVVVLAVVAIDLVRQPANWIWMFTYLYGGNWGEGVPGSKPILVYAIAFAVPLVVLFIPTAGARKVGVALAAVVAIGLGGYVLNWYIVGCGPHWSQKNVLQTYYRERKGPQEQLVAWQFNWRGETWYTAAEVVVSKSLDNAKIIEWLKQRTGRRFFFITERSRFASLRAMLPTPRGKETLKIVDGSNVHYVLAAAEI